jgi:hypothetical protein
MRKMKIYLATWTEQNQGVSLNALKKRDRLISYYFLQDVPPEWVEIYVRTGVFPKKKEWEDINENSFFKLYQIKKKS